jgi:DNA-directed RNA polymerase subunit H (RpoH/RPB5)
MHYLMPLHEILSKADEDTIMNALSITKEELPNLIYEDAALQHLRIQGTETPVNSVVKITIVRSKYDDTDSDDPADRTRVRYRVIKRV